MADGLTFQGDGLRGLSLDVRAAAEALGREAPATLIKIGEGLEERARVIAGDYSWKTGKRKSISASGGETTQQVVDSINGRLDGRFTYRIQAGEGVPLAGLWELGNRDSTVGTPYFWHPLFGKPPRYYQSKHPFLRPALAADRRNITRQMEEMWDRALGPYRLRPSAFSGQVFDMTASYALPSSGFSGMTVAETVTNTVP